MTDRNLQDGYSKLFKDGKLVQVHVSNWKALVSLDKEDLEIDKDLPSIIKLGNKQLIASERLAKINRCESRARRYLKKHSFDFPIAETHFVPTPKLVDVCTELRKYKEDFDNEVQIFLTNYEVYKNEMLEAYPDYAGILRDYYPPLDKLQTRFSFAISVFEVAFPSKVEKVEFEALTTQQEVREKVEAEVKSAYEHEMELQYNHALQKMNEFVNTCVSSLRAQVVSVLETISNKIRTKEVVTTTNIKSIRRMVTDFKALDFFNDSKINSSLDSVMALVDGNGDSLKDDHEAIQRLGIALNDVLAAASNMSDVDDLTGEYFRNLSF